MMVTKDWLFAKVIKKMKWPNVRHNVFLYLIPEIAKSRYRLPVTFYCSKLFAWEAQNSAIKLRNLPNRQLLARTSSQSWDEFEKFIFNCGSEVNHCSDANTQVITWAPADRFLAQCSCGLALELHSNLVNTRPVAARPWLWGRNEF